MITLGDKVKDTISSFEGIVVGKATYLNGCVRFEVKSKGLKDGKSIESEWIDEGQLVVVKEAKKQEKKEEPSGGPKPRPSKFSCPK